MSRTVVFYHSADLDGHCSGAIVRRALIIKGDEPEMIGIDYGDEFPWEKITAETDVVMVDFCLQPAEGMLRLRDSCNTFTWIDHHKTAIEALKDEDINGVRDVRLAACEICGGVFFPESPFIEAVYLLGRYDVWDKSNLNLWSDRIYPFQMGMRLLDTNPESELWRSILLGDYGPDRIIKDGWVVIKYQERQNKRLMDGAFDVQLNGLRCLAVNGYGNFQTFESKWDKTEYDAVLAFQNVRGEFWTCLLFTDKPEIDVSETAKSLGGGGHKQEAGFQCQELPFEVTS